jgi:hypothetical protein
MADCKYIATYYQDGRKRTHRLMARSFATGSELRYQAAEELSIGYWEVSHVVKVCADCNKQVPLYDGRVCNACYCK